MMFNIELIYYEHHTLLKTYIMEPIASERIQELLNLIQKSNEKALKAVAEMQKSPVS